MKILLLITLLLFQTPKTSFIFRTQIKIFFMKSESFLTLHRPQQNYHVVQNYHKLPTFKAQKGSKDIVKIISGPTVILWSYENTFCAQRKQK